MTATSTGPRTANLRATIKGRAAKALSTVLRTPPPTTEYRIHRGLRVPMRDRVELVADHYAPDTETPAGTLLVRGPYGRRWPFSSLYASVYASRGYHVLFQSVRGTFGSAGVFDPTVNEVTDGADTAAWLRGQPWFTGSFGTIGLSYLGATQWALMQDPPPELAAAVVTVGVHDFGATTWGSGSFSLNDFLGWSNLVSHQEDPGRLRRLIRQLRASRTVASAARNLPAGAAGRTLLGAGAPWWESWIEHPDVDDPFWQRYQFSEALDRVEIPVLLLGGWQDLFLEQTIEQYRRLRDRGVEVALTIGPWTHGDMMRKAAPTVLRESLAWLSAHLAGGPPAVRSPVRVFVTGANSPARVGVNGWLDLPDWPPNTSDEVRYLESAGRLTVDPAEQPGAPSTFTFSPDDPTPTVGGRLLSVGAGYRRDNALAERGDVLSFTGEPLTRDLCALGNPIVELAHESDNPHVDVFVRVSEVDAKGRSRNVSDGYRRLVREPGGGPVRIELDAIAHRFGAGSRLRVLIAGGSFPRFARNLGTDEAPSVGQRAVSVAHVVRHGGASRLILPAAATLPSAD